MLDLAGSLSTGVIRKLGATFLWRSETYADCS